MILHPNDMLGHPDAVYIGREHSGRGHGPTFNRSPWANPWNYRHLSGGRAEAVDLYRQWLAGDPVAAARLPRGKWHKPTPDEIRRELAGKTLSCWCPAGEPCHGHVLAEIASRPMEKNTATVTTGDCVELLAAMPAGAVDLVVADPPYNIGIDYGDGRRADELDGDQYAGMVRAWMLAIERALAPTGTLWIVCDAAYGSLFDRAIVESGLTIRCRGAWVENFGAYRATRRQRPNFGKCWRPWFHAVKDPQRFTFNFDKPELRVESERQRLGDKRADPRGKVRDNVWAFKRVAGTHRERVKPPAGEKPPTQLPLALVRMVVEGFTNPGDLVVDPFTGTGTTGVAAVQTGRQFAGIELREAWATLARQRIAGRAEDSPVEVAGRHAPGD